MPLVKAASLADLPPGALLAVRIGGKPVALCNSGGQIHALDGECPHNGGPHGHGALHGTMVVCPWHAWEFDCRTGELDYNPEVRVARYPVTVVGGDVFVEIGEDGARTA